MKLFFWDNVVINVAINMINNNRNCKNRTFSEFLLFKQHSHSYQNSYQLLYQILYQSLLFHMQSAAHEDISTLLAQYIHLLQHAETAVSQINHTDCVQKVIKVAVDLLYKVVVPVGGRAVSHRHGRCRCEVGGAASLAVRRFESYDRHPGYRKNRP